MRKTFAFPIFVFFILTCFDSFAEKSYESVVSKLIRNPVSIDPISDLITRSEYKIVREWIFSDNNPVIQFGALESGCDSTNFHSERFRKALIDYINNDFNALKLGSIFDRDIKERLLGTLYNATVKRLQQECSTSNEAINKKEKYFELINSYTLVVDSIDEMQSLINVIEEHDSVKKSAQVFSDSLTVNQKEAIAKSLNKTFMFNENVSINDINPVLDVDITLPDEINDVYQKLNASRRLYNLIDNIASNPSLSLDRKIDQVMMLSNVRLGNNERRGLQISSILAKYSSDNIDEVEAINKVVSLFKNDMVQKTAAAITTGNQLYKSLRGNNLDFSQLSNDDLVSIAPAVNSLTKLAFNISPESDDARNLDMITNIGVAYFTGNPVAIMSSISAFSNSSEPSPEQKQHQAVMAQLSIINKKLDKLLEGQENILNKVSEIEEKVTDIQNRIDDLTVTVNSARVDIMDGIGALRDTIYRHGDINAQWMRCLGQYDLLSAHLNLNSGIESRERYFRFQLRVGEPLGQGIKSLSFSNKLLNNENNERYKKWFESCYQYINIMRQLEREQNLSQTLSASSYDYTGNGLNTNTEEFKNTFSTLASAILCNNDNTQQCIRWNDSNDYLNMVERRAINIVNNTSNNNLYIPRLLETEPVDIFFQETGLYEIKVYQWLTREDILLNMLNPVLTNQVVHITLDLLQYMTVVRGTNPELSSHMHLTKSFLSKFRKYILLSILQQEVLSGAAYLDDVVTQYELRRLTDQDIELMKNFPELTRRFFILQCELAGGPLNNQCLDFLKSSSANTNSIELASIINLYSPFNSAIVSGSKIRLDIDRHMLDITTPSQEEVIGKVNPISIYSIHSRATLTILEEHLNNRR